MIEEQPDILPVDLMPAFDDIFKGEDDEQRNKKD